MAAKVKLVLFYQNYENWTGGTYYLQNLLQALATLPAKDAPEISILTEKIADFYPLQALCPQIQLHFQPLKAEYTLFQRVVNKISRAFSRRNFFEKRPVADFIFPLQTPSWNYLTELCKTRIFWIPDFQEEYLPHFFSPQDLSDRKIARSILAAQAKALLLSSEAAKADFCRFYPDAQRCPTFVLPFAVTHDLVYKNLNINHLREKYQLPKLYFFAPNQFWQHKNHQLILDAVLYLKEKNVLVNVAFSGKEYDFRNPDYTHKLKNFVKNKGLENQCFFLGFIDRAEQLQLMNCAQAVLQASLFEGWSTVVEDAKAMNQYILASDLPVHREQLLQNGEFFNPQHTNELADLLQKYAVEKPQIKLLDYSQNVQKFAANFIQILSQIDFKS